MWQILTAVLAISLLVVLLQYRQLNNELGRLADAIGDIHTQHSNCQLTIGTQQPQLARLATAINTLYSDMDANRATHRTAMDDIRQSMANISHDLRTPLTSILGYLKLMRGGGNSAEQQQHYLDVAFQKAEALNGLVGGLFELARLESGGYSFQHQRLDATAILAEELAGIYTQMNEKGLLPTIETPDIPLQITGDRDALGRVFANLLQNMVKHGRSPMAVTASKEGSTAVFYFSNKAPSLTQKDVTQVFQRFFTGDRMRSGKNTGLGLSIVKEFVTQMNGQIDATLQDGTLTVTLCWPLAV